MSLVGVYGPLRTLPTLPCPVSPLGVGTTEVLAHGGGDGPRIPTNVKKGLVGDVGSSTSEGTYEDPKIPRGPSAFVLGHLRYFGIKPSHSERGPFE